MAKRRAHGEGSIYQRKSDGLWIGTASVGWDDEGRRIRKTVSAKTRNEALAKLRVVQRHLEDGLPVPDASLTVEQLVERWYNEVLRHQVAISAADNYRSIAKRHLYPTLGKKRLSNLTVGDVDRLISSKVDAGYSTSTVRRIRSILAQALDQAIRWGSVNRNVATLSRPPKQQRSEGRTMTPQEARTLLEAVKGHRNEALYALMLSTGLRRGEALGLQWQDFESKSGVLQVRRQLKREGGVLVTSDTKTARSRRAVTLPTPMVTALKDHRERQAKEAKELGTAWQDTGFIFVTSVGTPMDPRNMYRDFQKICEGAGLGAWHPHELRHSAASLMLAQGVKLQVVSEVLGHASIRMTADVYGHILDPDRQAAADAMGSVLWQ